MTNLNEIILRIKADTSNFDNPKDIIRDELPQFWRGNNLRFEIGVFDGDNLLSVSSYASITVAIRKMLDNGEIPSASHQALMQKSTYDLNDALTIETWRNGSLQHASIQFSAEESNILSGNHWLSIWASTSDAVPKYITLCAGIIRVCEDGGGISSQPPEPLVVYYTARECDDTFVNKDNVDPNITLGTSDEKISTQKAVKTYVDSIASEKASTASNLGSGEGVFSSKSGANLQFKSLKAGSNVTISSDSSEITISSTGGGGGGGMSNPMTTSGDLIVGGTSGIPTRLGIGSAGKFLKVGSSGNSIEWGDGSSYTLPPATSNTLGGIKVGNNLSVTQDGTLSADAGQYELPVADANTLGGIKVGERLSVTSGGVLSANDQSYTLPPATSNTLGGIKVGSNLSVTQDGTLSADAGQYELPVASSNTLGGIKIGERLSVTSSGVLSANDQSYTLPPATSNTLGGIKVGSNLSVTQDGTLSADDQSYTLPIASASTLGGVRPDGSTITVNSENGIISSTGEVNTASNLGSGEGVFSSKSGANLQFKSLKAGSNVTISSDSSEITISSDGGGSGGMSNPMTTSGDLIVGGTSGTPMRLGVGSAGKFLKVGSSGNSIEWGDGSSYTLPPATSNTLGGIKVGNNLSVTQDGTLSADAGQYELPVASTNTLGGIKVGERLSITSGGVLSANDQSYTLPPATSNTLGGIKVGSNLSVTQDGTLSADDQSYTLPIASASTLGGVRPDGSTITINSESGVISSTGEANTASNLGSGEGVFSSKSGANLQFKSLKAGSNVTISADSSEITISSTGGGGGGMSNPMTTSGDLIVGGTSGTPTRLGIGSAGKYLKVGSYGNSIEWGDGSSYTLPPATSNTLGGIKVGSNLSVTQDGTLSADDQSYTLPIASDSTLGGVKPDGSTITINSESGVISSTGEANTASNLGSGEGVFSSKSGANLQLKSLKAGSNVTISSDSSEITISSDGGSGGGMSNPMTTSGDLIVGGTYGTPTRLGVGSAGKYLKVGSSGNSIEWGDGSSYTLPPATSNTLGGIKVGNNLSVTQDGTLSADAGQYELPVADANTLGGIKIGERLSVTSSGVLSANDQSYTLSPATSNTLGGIKVGNNLSVTQDGTLSADDQSYTLPIASANTLGGVKPDGNTITINSESGVISSTGEANTASNLGSGEGIFSSKSGANLQFKSLKAGNNVTISSDSSEITIAAIGGGSGGMSNPMTTSGDLIVGGTSGTPTRLGVGSAGKYLKVGSSGNSIEWGDGSSYTLPPATSNTLGGIKVGNNLSVTQDGTLSADAGQYELPVASTNTLGGIKVGERLSVTSGGVLSANDQSYTLPPATSNTLGGIKVGNNLSVTQDGTLSADAGQYELPVASANTLGGIKIGERLSITSGGVLSANDQSYTLPPATSNTLGGIKVGSNLSITQDGTLSADAGQYELPVATTSTLGGIKIGERLSVTSGGVLSANDQSYTLQPATSNTLGGIKVGNNLSVTQDGTLSADAGQYELPVASTNTLGGIKVGERLSITSGGVLSANDQSYTLQPATSNTLGGIKVGNNLSVTQDGTLSADDQSYTLPIASASTLGGVKPDGSTITINSESGVISSTGEANTASNLGSGEGVFSSKSGATLQLKSLKAGSNVTISSDSSEITISASGGGGGMSNPMTTYGDLIVGGTSGTPTRLGVGSAEQALVVNNNCDGVMWKDVLSCTSKILSSNGYFTFSDGLILQWGYLAFAGTNRKESTITLPVSFSSKNYSFSGLIKSNVSGTDKHSLCLSENARSSSTLTVCIYGADSSTTFNGITWIAIGY